MSYLDFARAETAVADRETTIATAPELTIEDIRSLAARNPGDATIRDFLNAEESRRFTDAFTYGDMDSL